MDDAPAALDPAGPQSEALSSLSWLLIGVSFSVLAIVIAATLVALFGKGSLKRAIASRPAIVAGGLLFPTIVVTGLLIYSLGITEKVAAAEPQPGDVRIRIAGEMWWWRVHYMEGDREVFETANEIHIPVGRPVTFELGSNDVIHSFWVPRLGGKMDMIPGRRNHLRLQADEVGVFRGQCAEYCGGAHALMALEVVAQPKAEYDTWVAQQSMPVDTPTHPGWTKFADSGCGACHSVRGTDANGRIGPDLTHLASRRMIAAALRPNTPEVLRSFVAHAGEVKPGLRMPDYQSLPDSDIVLIAEWLGTLK